MNTNTADIHNLELNVSDIFHLLTEANARIESLEEDRNRLMKLISGR